MKKIATKSYVSAQMQNVKFDPKRLKNPNQPNQQDPKIKTFQQAFTTLGLPGIVGLSEPDAMSLNNIQAEIRKKLRFFGFQPGF